MLRSIWWMSEDVVSLPVLLLWLTSLPGSTSLMQLATSESGILQRFGKFLKVLSPGINIINPMTDSVVLIDLKTKVATMPRQPVITKDNITLQIQTAVYYRVVDSFKVAYKLGSSNQGAQNFIVEMSQAALRSVGGEHTLQDMLSNRDKIARELQRFVENQVEPWGLLIENIFLKGNRSTSLDLVMDPETQKNLSAAAKQKRLSEAAIISAKADVESAKMMKEAAEILDSKAAMQIRYL